MQNLTTAARCGLDDASHAIARSDRSNQSVYSLW